jgi:SAM-dependent methyltransferase
LKGYDITGIDLSAASIAAATKAARPRLRFRRQDMRESFGRRTFDYVFNLFTSFGYFQDPGDHEVVVRNITASLKDNGRLVLDYLNVRYADAALTPREDVEIDGVMFRITRSVEGRSFVKRIVVDDGAAGPLAQYEERVARFTLADFARLFGAMDLTIEAAYGTSALGPYDSSSSPRLILVARNTVERLLPRQLLADPADGLGRHAQV